MNNSFFSNEFDALFNSMFNDMNQMKTNNYTKKRYYINGQEVTPEQLAALKQQGYQFKEDQQPSPVTGQNNPLAADGILGKLGRNLTEEARQGKLDPVIGRDKEIQDTAEVLSRRIKNNPILVGEAGVGKTAIVEGLAQEIVKGNVPASIKDKEIYSLDISALEAGTQYRGAFEENVQKLLDEVKAHGNIVLFLDEIHQMIGAGSTGGDSGSKGLSDIMKPALSRGEISVIGATTQDEYRNTILKDAALSRRFNEVVVNEPSKEDAFEILKGIRDNYEKHHNVEIPDAALKAAIELSIQYIPQRTLPDKAIDLMDITAAHVSAAHTAVDKVEADKQIQALTAEKEQAVQNEEYEKASQLQAQIKELNDKVSAAHDDNKNTVTVDEVAATVERLTGIPVSKMDADDLERLKNIQSRLEEKIIGQADAVKAVSRAIRRNRAGFDEGNRPIGSFLFVGPTGVGKTELAKQLAVDLFDSRLCRLR